MELFLRILSLVGGLFLFWTAASAVISTMLTPRPVRQWLSRMLANVLHWFFAVLAWRIRSYTRVDRLLLAQGPVAVLFFLSTFLLVFIVAFALIFHGLGTPSMLMAFLQSGSGLSTLGILDVSKPWHIIAMVASAFTGTIVVAIFIGFLMALYVAFSARESVMGKLALAIGEPAWGAEFLVRLHRLGTTIDDSDISACIDWLCTLRVNQYIYPLLNHFRSPSPRRHWVTTLLALCDAAAIRLANSNGTRNLHLVRLIAEGSETFHVLLESELARTHRQAPDLAITSWRLERSILDESQPTKTISDPGISRQEWDWAMDFLTANGLATNPDRQASWQSFCALRSLYAGQANFLAEYLHAVPAPWSRHSQKNTPPRFETIFPQLAHEYLQNTASTRHTS